MLDLTKLGFEDIVNQLKAKLLEKDAWRDTYIQSTGTVLIELYAYMSQLLLYYLKRTAEEQFFDSAQFWSSIVKVANLLNLYVKRPRGAYGYVKMRYIGSESEYVVNKFTPVTCGDGVCYVGEDVVLVRNEWKDVLVKQGVRKSESFIVSNPYKEKFVLEDVNASYEDLEVKAGNVAYEVVTDLFEGGDKCVRICTNPNRKLVVQMFKTKGLPPVGSVVTVEYSSVDPDWFPNLTDDWFLSSDVEVRLDSINSWVKGSSWESVEELKARFVNLFGTGKRLVTKEDFELVFKSLSEIEKVKVYDVKDEFKAPFRGVKVYVKLVDSWELSEVFLNKVEEEIVGRIGIQGVKVDVRPVQKVDVDVYVQADKKVGYSHEQCRSEVVNKLQEMYEEAEIGQWVSISDIQRELRGLGYRKIIVVEPVNDLEIGEGVLVNLKTARVEVI